jgi:hypothetical protein
MSDEYDYRDKDGNVYKKYSDGSYEQLWDMWSQRPRQDNAEIEDRPDGVNETGKWIYRRRTTPVIKPIPRSTSNSSSGDEGTLYLIAFFGFLAMCTMGAAFTATPIIAPVLYVIAENARKRGDIEKYKNRQTWATVATVIASIFALILAGIIGLVLFSRVSAFAKGTIDPFLKALVYLLGIAACLGVFTLSFLTVLSPTTFVYLHLKEARLFSSGKNAKAVKTRILKIVVCVIPVVTIMLAIITIIVTVVTLYKP